MNVAFCTWKFPAHSNTFVLNEIVEVQRQGHGVSIWSIDRSDDTVVHGEVARCDLLERTRYLADFVKGGRLDPQLERYRADWLGEKVRALPGVAARMRAEGTDVVHGCFMNNSATVAMACARLAGLPWTFECHAHDLFVDLRFAEDKILEAAAVFAISAYNRGYLVDALGCDPGKVVIRRVPILRAHCDAIAPGPREESHIVSVGRLHPIKGLEDAVRAFALVARRFPQARYTIFGDGPLRGRLQQLAAELGVGSAVVLAGNVTNEQVLTAVARASLSVLPSVIAADGDRDGIPTSLIESMYLRTPAVSTRVSGIPELIDDGDNGFLTAPGDVAAIAERIELLLADPARRALFGARARAKVLAEFDPVSSTEALLARWRGLVRRRGWISRLRSWIG